MLINSCSPAEKKTIAQPHPKHCNRFNGYNGNCIGFNGNYNGVYWYVMDCIGGMLNPVRLSIKNLLLVKCVIMN